MKIIFLDFDGVLNSSKFMHAEYNAGRGGGLIDKLDSEAVNVLNEVVKRTNAKIVVSSTWRLGRTRPELQAILNRSGFVGVVIDKTGTEPDRERGNQIQKWLDDNKDFYDIESFVIVDDCSDMAHLMHRLVQTRFEDGLTPEYVERIITMLNGDNK